MFHLFQGDCTFVSCVPDEWSSWSAKCGKAQRSRDINTVNRKIQKLSCDGLLQSCPENKESQERVTLCKSKFFNTFLLEMN